MNKPSLAVMISSLSALSYQAAADEVINIDKAKVSDDLADAMKSQFSQLEPANIVEGNFMQFCQTIKLDGEELEIDVEAFLASKNASDSTKVNTSSKVASAGKCYTNCYNNCHGSRGWR